MKAYIKKILEEMEHDPDEKLEPDELLDIILNYEGLIGYGSTIRMWIHDVYSVEFK